MPASRSAPSATDRITRGPSPTRRLVLAAAGALLLPRSAGAQPAKRRRIAFLDARSRVIAEPFVGAFRHELRTLGYGDADVAIEIRYADGRVGRLPDLAVELVHLAPEVIVAAAPPAIQAAKQATSTVPIVMATSGDPIGAGFVASLAHPGGNVTGLANFSLETVGKSLDLLKTAIPGAERIAILVNPSNSQHAELVARGGVYARLIRCRFAGAREPVRAVGN